MAVVRFHEQFAFRATPMPNGDVHLYYMEDDKHEVNVFPYAGSQVDEIIEKLREAKARAMGIDIASNHNPKGRS